MGNSRFSTLKLVTFYLFHKIGKFGGGFSLLGHLNLVGVDIIDGFHITEAYTPRIAVTIITLLGDSFFDIEKGMSKRTCNNTGLTSNTFILINDYSLVFRILVTSFCWTYLRTVGCLTILAGHGKVESHILPFYHPDSGPAGVAGSRMKHRTDQLAEPASGALFMVDDKHLFHGFSPANPWGVSVKRYSVPVISYLSFDI
jgi:hypothetical protein